MRKKDINWTLPEAASWDSCKLAVLMDLRDELKAIREALMPLRHLNCPNFISIPGKLDRLIVHTRPKKRKKMTR